MYTIYIRKAIDTLFFSHRVRTSLGVLLGAGLHGLLKLFEPYLKRFKDTIDILALGWLECLVFGILLMHIQTLYYLFLRKSPQDEKIDSILQIIEDGKKLGLPEWQIKQMYNATFVKILENLDLNDETKKELEKLESKGNQSQAESTTSTT